MSWIEIRLLGSFRVALRHRPITAFHSDKVRALFAYLVVESPRSHRRETLCGLLWPDYPERSARQSLSQALYALRQALGAEADAPDEVLLRVSRQDVSLSVTAQVADVVRFAALIDQARREERTRGASAHRAELMRQALALYGGDLLEGFSLADCPAFEEWLQIERERLLRQAVEAASALALQALQNGDCGAGLTSARRWLALAPLDEGAHRCLMRLLVADGHRSAALIQYGRCAQVLEAELGIAPEGATTALYDRIRAGQMVEASATGRVVGTPPPAFLRGQDRFRRPLFVSREDELSQLSRHLATAISGEPRVVFVTGDAGSGKTALLREFALRAVAAHRELVSAVGHCTLFSGRGDPHLAFRELFAQLTGDIESRWVAGMLSREQALRLWSVAPGASQALTEQGPDLVGTLLPGSALVARITRSVADGQWLDDLRRLAEIRAPDLPQPGHPQPALFSQCAAVLARIAQQTPMLLILEDLHWADAGTLDLLFHLGSSLQGAPILIVGSYRPLGLLDGQEVYGDAAQRTSARHPLIRIVNEFRRRDGDVRINLDETDPLDFVEALVDSEPNRLDLDFRQTLATRSGGIALFVVELVRSMKERGELSRDVEDRWQVGAQLEWDAIPTRIEGVLAQRVGRLDPASLQAIMTASVLGESFGVAPLAHMLGVDAREAVRVLSRHLHKRHHLVSPLEVTQKGGSGLGRYRFRHALIRDYVYSEIDPAERRLLHCEACEALKAQHGAKLDEIAGRLAWHCEQAGDLAQSIDWLCRAGRYALSLTALQDAAGLFRHGSELLETLPAGIDRDRRDLALQIGLGNALHASRGMSLPETAQIYHRIYVLSQELDDRSGLSESLQLLNAYYGSRGQLVAALAYAQELLALAMANHDEELGAVAGANSGWVRLTQGDLRGALEDLQLLIGWYDAGRTLVAPSSDGCYISGLCNLSDTLFVMGLLDEGARRMVDALSSAHDSGQPGQLCRVYAYDARQCMYLGDAAGSMKALKEGMSLASDYGLPTFEMTQELCLGWAKARLGSPEEGLQVIEKAIAAAEEQEAGVFMPWMQSARAEALGLAGRSEKGLVAVERGLQAADETGARLLLAELQRIEGDLQMSRREPDVERAESAYLAAIETCRTQGARLWELRACVSLGRLWRDQGKSEKAKDLVHQSYASFAARDNAPDLMAARALLAELDDSDPPEESLGRGVED